MNKDLLPEYVLGLLTPEAQRKLDAELARSPELLREARETEEALLALSDRLPSVRTGTASGRARLMATLSTAARFERFFPLLQRWFDLDQAAVVKVLTDMDGGKSWIAAPFAGVRYFHFASGPAALAKESGCVRVAAGARFPRHEHAGRERALILEGTLLLDGRIWHVGDVVEAEAGTAHAFAAGPERDLVFIVGHDGVSFTA